MVHDGVDLLSLSVLILTYNEEVNLPSTLESLKGWVGRIVVIDSYSTDRTVEIAEAQGCEILQKPFENHAHQVNWGLEHAALRTDWVMRLDADERVTPELRDALVSVLPTLGDDVGGIVVRRRVHFMGRWIKHGGYYPTWLLRIWRNGAASCEVRWMDEHIKLARGRTITLKQDIVDENRRPLTWWIDKHNRYATREAVDLLNLKGDFVAYDSIRARLWGPQVERRRWLKEHVYALNPPLIRPFFYFLYRYIFRGGFLDGVPGLIWHFLQGCWYRFLVDAKIYEIQRKARMDGIPMKVAIKELHGIEL
jgi:glycosyltransferase involved in cell wall biosynthesis